MNSAYVRMQRRLRRQELTSLAALWAFRVGAVAALYAATVMWCRL